MAYGMQVWDASGNTILDTNWSITRILGIVSGIGSSAFSGSVTNAAFSTGRFFWMFSPKVIGTDSYGIPINGIASASLSGSTLNWTVNTQGLGYVDCGSIIYGVY